MGTNYYLEAKPPCKHCGQTYEPLHIGKSSAGWNFSLHVIPEEGINTLDDWRRLWSAPGARIRNEYGEEVHPEDMELCITARAAGLQRHPIDRRCIGHGEGTWDYITGEFS